VPRLINLVCDRALQRAFEARRKTIDRDIVSAAVRDLDLDERRAGAELGAADVLTLPFEPVLEVEAAPPVAAPIAAPAAMASTPKPESPRRPAEGTIAFEPEAPSAARPEPANALSEFDSEPKGSPEHTTTPIPSVQSAPSPGGAVWALARALGFAMAVLVIAAGAGVLDTRTAFDLLSPNLLPGLPAPRIAPPQSIGPF
jgi:hypothetical protein